MDTWMGEFGWITFRCCNLSWIEDWNTTSDQCSIGHIHTHRHTHTWTGYKWSKLYAKQRNWERESDSCCESCFPVCPCFFLLFLFCNMRVISWASSSGIVSSSEDWGDLLQEQSERERERGDAGERMKLKIQVYVREGRSTYFIVTIAVVSDCCCRRVLDDLQSSSLLSLSLSLSLSSNCTCVLCDCFYMSVPLQLLHLSSPLAMANVFRLLTLCVQAVFLSFAVDVMSLYMNWNASHDSSLDLPRAIQMAEGRMVTRKVETIRTGKRRTQRIRSSTGLFLYIRLPFLRLLLLLRFSLFFFFFFSFLTSLPTLVPQPTHGFSTSCSGQVVFFY